MELIQSSNDRQTVMAFVGALDLSQARQAHQALAEAIRNYAHVAVQVARVEVLDQSFLQLICAAHRTALSQKKRFTLTIEDLHHFKKLLVECGFQHHCGCDAEAAAPCIWQAAVFNEALDCPDPPPEMAGASGPQPWSR